MAKWLEVQASRHCGDIYCTPIDKRIIVMMVRVWCPISILIAFFCIASATCSDAGSFSLGRSFFEIRGGLVPQADEAGGDYYEQFELDYGSADKRRVAGATRGFIRSGKLAGLPESDPFKKWLNQHLEKGAEPISGRVKPFYAADFGTKADLQNGEHPRVMIVQRKLATDENGVLTSAPAEFDVEIRNIWQPWLRSRCNFAVRYIVPSRVNIIRILEAKKRFSHEVEIDDSEEGDVKLWSKMTFKPRLVGRLMGKRNSVIWRELDSMKAGSNNKVSSSTRASPNPFEMLAQVKSKLLSLSKKK